MEGHPRSSGKCEETHLSLNIVISISVIYFYFRTNNYQAVCITAAPVKPKHIFPQYHKGSESFFSVHSSFIVPKGSFLKVGK